MLCVWRRADYEIRGNEIGLAKMEAASLEGEAIMEGGLKVMNLISSTLLFMTWNIEL